MGADRDNGICNKTRKHLMVRAKARRRAGVQAFRRVKSVSMMGKTRRREDAQGAQFSRL